MNAVILLFAAALNFSGITNDGMKKPDPDSIRFNSMTDPVLDTIVVARVGDVTLTAKDFVLNYYMGPSFFLKASNPRHALLDAMTDEAMFSVAARDSLPCVTYLYEWKNSKPRFAVGPRDTTVKEEIALASEAIWGDLITEQLYRKRIWDTINVRQEQIEKAVDDSKKQVSFRWLYASTSSEIDSIEKKINSIGFDSVYAALDSSHSFQRTADYFHLEMTSPEIYKTMELAKEGGISVPMRGGDGYYVFKIDQITHSPIMTDYEKPNLSQQFETEIRQHEADVASDKYVDQMMRSVAPIIDRNAFDLLCGNIASKYLSADKFNAWHMSRLLMSEAGPIAADEVRNRKSTPLINYRGGSIDLGEFFEWYDLRSSNFNISNESRESFMRSVGSYVWRMLRDKLLVKQAVNEGLANSDVVEEQMQKWNLKLSYLSLLQHASKLMRIDSNDVEEYYKDNYVAYERTGDTTLNSTSRYEDARRDYIEYMTRATLLHTKALIQRDVKVSEYYSVVDKLSLIPQSKTNPIEVFFFKTGGTFPRKAYPTIDEIWQKIIP